MKKKARRSIGFAYAMWLAGAVTGLFGLHRFYLQRKKSGSIMVGIVALGVALWAYGMFQIFAPVLEQASALLASGGDFAPLPSSSPPPAAAVAEKAAAFLQGGDVAGRARRFRRRDGGRALRARRPDFARRRFGVDGRRFAFHPISGAAVK